MKKYLMYQFNGSNHFVLLQPIVDVGDWDMKSVDNGGVFWIAEAVVMEYKEFPARLRIPSIYGAPDLIDINVNHWKMVDQTTK